MHGTWWTAWRIECYRAIKTIRLVSHNKQASIWAWNCRRCSCDPNYLPTAIHQSLMNKWELWEAPYIKIQACVPCLSHALWPTAFVLGLAKIPGYPPVISESRYKFTVSGLPESQWTQKCCRFWYISLSFPWFLQQIMINKQMNIQISEKLDFRCV